MRLFVAGDTHGNDRFITGYLYPTARDLGADAIVQVGDFGLWEHDATGVEFLDQVSAAATEYQIPLYALRGNHDNYALALSMYGDQRTEDGFIRLRPGVHLLPDGVSWTWAGRRLRAFGGAYSIDKPMRLKLEAQRTDAAWAYAETLRKAGLTPEQLRAHMRDYTGTLWFPDEEMTDEQMDRLLAADSGPLDVIFSHDRPASANCGFPLRDELACVPNTQRLQRALTTHQPAYLIHGHLHYNYTDTVRSGDDGRATTVIGLASDSEGGMRSWRPHHAWCLLDLHEGKAAEVRLGQDVDLDGEELAEKTA
jgi:hypothetical protein